MFIENNAILITILLIAICVISYLPSMVREIELSNRKKISYFEYNKTKNVFNLKPRKVMFIIYSCCLIALVTFVILFSISNVTRIFDFVIVPFIVFTVLMIIVELRITKTNKDLSAYDSLYLAIENTEKSKEVAIQIVEEYSLEYDELFDKTNNIIKNFNSCLNINLEFDEVHNLLNEFKDKINIIKLSLDNYDKTIVSDFNNSIHEYIYTNNLNFKNISSFEKPNESEFIELIKEIKDTLNVQIAICTEEALKTRIIKSNEALISLLEINKSLNNEFDSFMNELLLYVDSLKDKTQIVTYINLNNILSIDSIINKINVNDYDWFYSIKLNDNYSKYLESIVSSVINCNAIKCTYAFLNNNSNLIGRIENVINKNVVNNDSYDIFKIYLSLYLTSSSFNNDTNKYENMTYALLDYYNKTKDKKMLSTMDSIIVDASYMHNSKLIEDSYNQILNVVNDYSNNYLNVLVIYGKSSCKNHNYIDYDKVLSLFQEYKSSLNLNGIHNLIMLLEGILLIEEVDSNIVNPILNNVDSDLIGKKHIDTGRNIINYLNKNEHNDLIRIIYRIEKVRLSYDMIVRL